MLASEYGWTKDYIYYNVYPDEILPIAEKMGDRKRRDYLVQLRIVTNPHLKAKDQKELFSELSKEVKSGLQNQTLDKTSFANLKRTLTKQSKIVVK